MHSPREIDRRTRRLVWILSLLPAFLGAGETGPVPAPALRLRFEWGGGKAEVWGGLLEISQGKLEQPRSLGIEADEPGTLWIDDGALWMQRRTPRVYDGFDVTITAPANAVLSMNLQAAGERQPRERIEVRVSDLYNKRHAVSLGGADKRLVIRRMPGDVLAIRLDRPHVIYEPGEQFQASVALNALDTRERQLTATLQWRLTTARGTRALASGTRSLAAATNAAHPAAVPIALSLPEEEGVYTIRFSATGRGFDNVESAVQVVVLAPQSPLRSNAAAAGAERLVDEFEPATASVFRKVSSRAKFQKLESSLAKLLRIGPEQNEAENGQSGEATPVWAAYRLRLEHADRPHLLVVAVPAETAQNLGVSIIQPNAAGQVMPVGLDSGLRVTGGSAIGAAAGAGTAGSAPRTIEHRLLFWPQLREPILLLYGLKPGQPIVVGKVQAFELGERLPSAAGLQAIQEENATRRRLVGPYMHKPLLPENFGASEFLDPASQRSLDDWETFFTAGHRLVDYLHFQGHNALLLAVLADGSTIYPSKLLDPSPRYDTGAFAGNGQDPFRKDVLELLFQLFDREGLALIPELQFSTPLPALERLLTEQGTAAGSGPETRNGGQTGPEGIALVGRDGRTWTEAHGSQRGLAPYYNPLDPRVQRAILDVVQELVARYQDHPSFRGLALELSNLGSLQMPGLEWGYDAATVGRFEQATGQRVPHGSEAGVHQQRYDFLTTKAGQEWTRWRCAELARFHLRLARLMTAANPDAQVFLSGHRFFWKGEAGGGIQQLTVGGGGLEQLLPSKGLDLSLYAGERRLTVLRPHVEGNADRLLGPSLVETLNTSHVLDAAYRSVSRGSLFYNLPSEHRIPAFDSASPWQPAYTWLVPQVVSSGDESRKRYVHALAALDSQAIFEGGWMILLGPEHETRDLRDAIAALPAVPFQPSGPQAQPAVVRIAHLDGGTWLYVANDAALPVRLELQLSCPATTACRRLGVEQPVTLHTASGNSNPGVPPANVRDASSWLSIDLGGYDIWCCQLSHAQAEVLQARVTVPSAALVKLQDRIERLHEQMHLAGGDTKPHGSPLSNPGFELASAKRQNLPGWDLPVQNAAYWTLDGENPHSGKSALRLMASRQEVSLASPELPLEGTRFLTMTLWMRSKEPAATARLVFEAQIDGHAHRQQATVQVGPTWQRYLFRVKNVPSGKMERPRIRVEPQGPGPLWIDDVEINSQRLTPDEIRQLTKTLSAVTLAWEERRYADCQRLLDGYWGQLLLVDEDQIPVTAEETKPRVGTRVKNLFRR